MFAPVVMRFATYGVSCGRVAARYCEAMRAAQGVRRWVEGAADEAEFVADDEHEPYAEPPRP